MMFIRNLATAAKPLKPTSSSLSTSKLKKDIPSLEEYLFKQRVKQVYRSVLRQLAHHHEKRDLTKFIRDEFKVNEAERDLTYRKYLLSQGLNRIGQMSASLGLNIRV